MKHALIDVQTNPFHTDFLFFPQGADLYLGGVILVSGVMSIPLQIATENVILSWNVVALLSLVFSALSMYALAYRVTRNHVAAFVSGFIFGFAPFTLMRLQGGEYNIFTTWPIPLFVLFLLRFQETGRLREAAAAGICWALLTYNWLEYATEAGLLLGLFVAYWSIVYLLKRNWARLFGLWRGLLVIAGVWFGASALLLVPALQAVYSGDFTLSPPGAAEFYSGDLLTFVTPSPLWGSGLYPESPDGAHLPVGSIESTAYLGIVPLMLAGLSVFAVRRSPHRVLLWGAIFFMFAILSLGPYLYVDATKGVSVLGVSLSVPLPYQLYDDLPVFGARRIPARMIIFGIVGLSVLAGVGLDLLMGWMRPRYGKVVPVAAAVLVFSLVVVEYWNPPVHLSELSMPAILEEIKDEEGDFTVLHAPLGRRDGFFSSGDPNGGWITNYYVPFHGRPSIGGYVNRSEGLGWIMEQPGLAYLACPRCPDHSIEARRDPELVRSLFRQHRIKYVVLHTLDPFGQGLFYIGESELVPMDAYLRDVLGLVPIHTDSTLTVYRNQEVGQEDG